MSNDENKRVNLFKTAELGAKAADIHSLLAPILSRRKAELVDKLETNDFYYQKIDNSELLMIQLEMKLLKKFSSDLAAIVRDGTESVESLRAMNEPAEPVRPKRPLRY